MMDQYIKVIKRLSNMTDLSPQGIIEFIPKKVGRPWGSVSRKKLELQLQEMVRKQFNCLKIISAEIQYRKRSYILTECVTCLKQTWRDYTSVISEKAGCRKCGNSNGDLPKWLLRRMNAARQRCTNPNNMAYERYGARGIQFKFATVLEAAIWIKDNLGLDQSKEIDRKNNNGHYEAGNLRYLTKAQNQSNTRAKGRWNVMMHQFRLKHPQILYADITLKNLFAHGLTEEQILKRYLLKTKPKGFGILSIADPIIASL